MIETAFSELRPLVGTKGACLAVGRARASHYRRGRPSTAGPAKPRPTPPNALSEPERAAVLEALHGERFVDRARQSNLALDRVIAAIRSNWNR